VVLIGAEIWSKVEPIEPPPPLKRSLELSGVEWDKSGCVIIGGAIPFYPEGYETDLLKTSAACSGLTSTIMFIIKSLYPALSACQIDRLRAIDAAAVPANRGFISDATHRGKIAH